MNARSIATLAAAVFVMTLGQFFGALGNIWIALTVALLLPLVTLGLGRFFEAEWGVPVKAGAPAGSSALGILFLVMAQGNADILFWCCPFLALLVSGTMLWMQSRNARRCGLCNRTLSGKVALGCPRCGLEVCDQTCWDFDKLRCRLCVQNHVPVLPPDGRWWDQNFGPATQFGRCQLCQTTAQEAELRNCPNCGRPQCRDCWDDANGVCTRCNWTVRGLPETLQVYMQ